MKQFNFSIVEGNLIENPLLNNNIATFTIEVRRNYIGNNGERVSMSQLFNIMAHGKLGATCCQYLKKGSRVLISGGLKKIKDDLFIEARDINFIRS